MNLGDIEVILVNNNSAFSEAKEILEEVALERGWPISKVVESHPHSIYWIVYKNSMPAGVIKIVIGSPDEFPIKDADGWPNLSIPAEGSLEVAMAAVKSEFRGVQDVFLAMFAKMYVDLKDLGTKEIYAILDRKIFVLYKRIGLPFQRIPDDAGGGNKVYWGEETFPACLSLSNALQELEKKQNRLWQLVCIADRQKRQTINRKKLHNEQITG